MPSDADRPSADELDELWLRRYATPDLAARVEALPPSPVRDLFEAQLTSNAGDVVRALGKATAAVAGLPRADRWRARALRRKAAVLADLGLMDEAVATSNSALDIAKELDDPALLAGILQDRATFSFVSEQVAVDKLREAMAIADTTRQDDLRALIRYNLGFTIGTDFISTAEKLALLADGEELAQNTWPNLAVRIAARRAELALEMGDLRGAQLIAAALPRPEALTDFNFASGIAVTLARVDIARGEPAEAVERLNSFVQRANDDERAELLPVLVAAHEALGNYREALRISKEERDLLLHRSEEQATASSRALEVWFRAEQAAAETKRQQARADELEVALQKLRAAHQRIHEISVHDALTELKNRQFVNDHAAELALDGAQVAMLDVDRFKRLNDDRGHRFGDAVLVRVAQSLRTGLGEADVIARYGGDEFLVIRPPSHLGDLAAELRPIVAEVAGMAWRETDQVGDDRVTVSAGVARVAQGDLEAAIHRADLLMYEAKRAGGNRVVDASA